MCYSSALGITELSKEVKELFRSDTVLHVTVDHFGMQYPPPYSSTDLKDGLEFERI